ncbi:MAG: flagellar hook capping FlgD N-terminal domain-containing protein [Solirubrobacterales bacterium]
MSSVSDVGGTSAGGEAAQVQAQNEADGFSKDEFLQLLVAQMKNQDPLNPVGSQEFMSQMTAFSTLEQITNVAVANEEMNQMAAVNQSLSLVGETVTYTKEDGTTGEGKVESVDFDEEGFSLTVDGESGVEPGTVTKVAE